MAFAETAELAVRLTLKDQLTGGLGKAQSALGRFDRATSNTQRALANTQQNLSRLATVGLAATAAGLVGVVKAAGDFEDAFAGVRKTVDADELRAAGITFDELAQTFRDMAKTMPITAVELARIGEAAGALGIAAQDIDDFTRVVATLSVTTNLTSDEAAESLGKLGTILDLTGKEFEDFADGLVALGNAGASTESEIIEVTKRFAAAGKQAGLTTDQILAYASAITSMGVEPEAAGSSLSRIFNNLAKETAVASDKAKAFAETIGLTFKDFRQLVADDPNKAIQSLLQRLNALQAAGKRLEAAKILQSIGVNNVRDINAILLLSQGLDKLGDSFETVAGKAGASSREAAVRFQTFNSQLQIAKNVLTDVGITIGSKLLPKLVPLLKRLGDFVDQNQAGIEAFGEDLARGFEEFADAVSNTDFTPLIDGLKLTVDIAKQAINLFRSLPEPIQRLLIAGAAVNKVTDGLITGLGKDLLGGFLSRFRGQTPAAPMFVSVVGGGTGIVTGGGGTSAASKVLSAVGKVFIVGAAVGVFAELTGVLNEQGRENRAALSQLIDNTNTFAGQASLDQMVDELARLEEHDRYLRNNLTPEAIAYQLNIDGVSDTVQQQITILRRQISEDAAEEHRRGERDYAQMTVQTAIQQTGFRIVATAEAANRLAINAAAVEALQSAHRTQAALADVQASIDGVNRSTNAVNSSVGFATRSIEDGDRRIVDRVGFATQAIERVRGATDAVKQQVGIATAQLERVRSAVDNVKTSVGFATRAIEKKDLSVKIALTNRLSNVISIDGRKFHQSVNDSTVYYGPGGAGWVDKEYVT